VTTRSPDVRARAIGSRVRVAALAALAASSMWSTPSRADSCTVSATTHSFGAYDTITATPATSAITVTCTHTNNPAVRFDYTIALSSGPGSYAARSMTGTTDTLTYNLYTTLAHSSVWGDGSSGTSTVSASLNVPGGAGRSASAVHTVFGLIPAPQNVEPGAYSTVTPITVTITY